MKKSLLIGTLFLFATAGAGCNPTDSPVSLDKYQMPETETAETSAGQATNDGQNLTQTAPPATSSQTVADESAAGTTPVASSTQTAKPTSTKPANPPQEKPMPEPTQPETLAFPGILPDEKIANKQIRVKTSKGDIVFEVLPKEGPKAASNFVYLTEKGFYNGLTFHRVEPGFVIQGGDPLGNGTGGPGYKFEDDTVSLPYNEGIVAMANAGPNTNGSQFFIMLANNPLPPKYSIFGRVTSGMDVVKKITIGDVMTSVTIEPKQ